MKPPIPRWHIAQQNLRIAPYLATVAGSLAAVLGVWISLHLSYLCLAVGTGMVDFFIQWFGVRRRTHLGFIATILTISACMIGRELLLPHDIDRETSFLYLAQFMSACIFLFSVLHLIYRKKLEKDFETYAPKKAL